MRDQEKKWRERDRERKPKWGKERNEEWDRRMRLYFSNENRCHLSTCCSSFFLYFHLLNFLMFCKTISYNPCFLLSCSFSLPFSSNFLLFSSTISFSLPYFSSSFFTINFTGEWWSLNMLIKKELTDTFLLSFLSRSSLILWCWWRVK